MSKDNSTARLGTDKQVIKWTDAQQTAIDRAGNLLVSASAGSGKTAVMVERVVRYISNGGEIDKIVVITFTRAAAADMKEKLLERLYHAIRTGHCGERRLTEKEVAHIAKQIPKAPFSYISTIDGFCAEIYRRYFEDIGGEPSITVLDESEANEMFALASDEVLDEYLTSGDDDFYQLIDLFMEGRSLDKVKEILLQIHKFVSVQEEPDDFFVKAKNIARGASPSAEYYLQQWRRRLHAYSKRGENILQWFGSFGSEADMLAKLRERMAELVTTIDKLRHTSTLDGFVNVLAGIEVQKKPNEINHLPEFVFELQESARQFLDDYREELIKKLKSAFLPKPNDANASLAVLKQREQSNKEANIKLMEVVQTVRERYKENKRKEGVADFADLGHFALKILSNKERASEVAQSITYIFLDEYQDTNYLQEAVISKISRDNVFMVGDVKQSIYKFRFAEPKIFLDKAERFSRGKEGSGVSLAKNFRSSKEILHFTNLVFSEIMTHSFGGVDYRKDAAFDTNTNVCSDSGLPVVRVAFFDKKVAKETETIPAVYSVKDGAVYQEPASAEAEYIASRIEQIVGKIKIFVGDEKKERFAEYGDIAILMRSRRGAAIRAELRKRGIPFVAPEFPGEAESYDTELLVCFLRVVDNFRNDIPLFSVMRSFFGGFSEAELAEIRSSDTKARNIDTQIKRSIDTQDSFTQIDKGKELQTSDNFFWMAVEGYKGKAELENKISAFINKLLRYRRLSHTMDAAELISLIIAETGYDGYLLSRDEQERMAYVNAFVHTLKGTGEDIREFLTGYDASGMPDINISSSTQNAVGFYTIHKSKGLEFPVVFFAEAQQGIDKTRQGKQNMFLDGEFGVALKWRDADSKQRGDTLSTYGFRAKQELEEKEELMRLMYVAITRARFHLFITGGSAKLPSTAEDAECFTQWLMFAADKNPAINKYFEKESFSGKYVQPKKALPVLVEADAPNLKLNYPEPEALTLSAKYTVSALNQTDGEQEEYGYVPFLDDKAAERGTAYHAFMEFADFTITDPKGIEAEIMRMGEEGVLLGGEHLDPHILSRTLKHPLFDQARKGKVIREKPFILYLPANEVLDVSTTEKTLIQGVIDLLITGEENILVDYKFTSASTAVIKERYHKQIALYDKAARLLMNIIPDKRVIFIINRGEVIEL